MIKRLCLFILLCTTYSAYSLDAVDLGYGQGSPANLQAFRIGGQWNWAWHWNFEPGWQLNGFWNADVGYWNSKGDANGNNRNLTTVQAGPNLRLEYDMQDGTNLGYYFDIGWGPALYSSSKLAMNQLGSFWGFQQQFGLGLRFGDQLQYDISYHYLDSTNYGIYSNNAGFLLGWVLVFTYHLN